MNLFDLNGKVVLITGSGGGIGLEIGLGLAKSGAHVLLNGRNKEKLEFALQKFETQALQASIQPFDVTKPEEISKAVESIIDQYGKIDVLINNAGIQRRHPLTEFPDAEWDEVLNINLKGAFLVAKKTVPFMIKNGGGKIINICSLQSELGRPTIAPYAAAKGGLKMLTRAMTVEWASHNIQVNAIGPGYFITEMTRKLADDPEFDQWIKSRTPANRWGMPEELVGTAVYLASAASDYVNGQIIYVDGGILASM